MICSSLLFKSPWWDPFMPFGWCVGLTGVSMVVVCGRGLGAQCDLENKIIDCLLRLVSDASLALRMERIVGACGDFNAFPQIHPKIRVRHSPAPSKQPQQIGTAAAGEIGDARKQWAKFRIRQRKTIGRDTYLYLWLTVSSYQQRTLWRLGVGGWSRSTVIGLIDGSQKGGDAMSVTKDNARWNGHDARRDRGTNRKAGDA